MESVIFIQDQNKSEEKPVEFTHYLSSELGMTRTNDVPNDFEKVVYLGKCDVDGDMFAAYRNGHIFVYKGHLNSGKY